MCQPTRIPRSNKNWMAPAQRHKIINYYVPTKHSTIVPQIPEFQHSVLNLQESCLYTFTNVSFENE